MIQNNCQKYSDFLLRFNTLYESDYQKLHDFLIRFKNFSNNIEGDKIDYYTNNYKLLFTQFDSVLKKHQEENSAVAEDFNIFEILKINTKEVITHSPIISMLLNPHGEHAQGNVFYKLFLEAIIKDENRIKFFLNENIKEYAVATEKHKIDISIISLNQKKRFALIIENKIYADDQYEQIQRYHKLYNKLGYDDTNFVIIYLTLDGRLPSNISITDKVLRKKLLRKNILIPISYRKEIVNWLENSLLVCGASKINHLIQQYISTVKSL